MNNSDELFARNVGRVNSQIFTTNDQTALFFQKRFSLFVLDVNTNQMNEVLPAIHTFIGIRDSPKMNRGYVVLGDDDEFYEKTVVVDRLTTQPIDTIQEDNGGFGSFLSNDENYLYQFHSDSIGLFFSRFAVNSKQSEPIRRYGNLGPFASFITLNDGKNGLALVSYETNAQNGINGLEYVVCDVDNNTTFSPIKFPRRSEAYFSSHAKQVIIEQVDFDTTRESAEYRPGSAYVFDAQSGKLTQRLILPPEGQVLVFDNYQEKFFYYIKDADRQQSIPVDVSAITPTPVLLDTLIALTQQAYTSGWIGNQQFVHQLDRDLQNASTKLAKRDSIGSAQELEAFQQEVRKEYLAKPKKNDKRFVTEDAYKLLYFNAQYVIERVITLPARSYAPLLDQLTALRAQIRIDAQNGFLGGEILLRGLEIMVDGAKQRLQRQDSVGTALYVLLFQQTVRQTHELTKSRPIGKIYVKAEGYISLYYRASYIMETLPEPFGHVMPKMEPELEQELQRHQRQVEQQR
jgi:hypothetical protein